MSKKIAVSRGRGRPDRLGAAIVEFIKSKPWNGRVVGLNDIFAAYSIERRNMGKLSADKDTEFKCANVHIQNMLRAGKLVRMSRGKYTTPEAAETIKAKSPKEKTSNTKNPKSKSKKEAKEIMKSIEEVSNAVKQAQS